VRPTPSTRAEMPRNSSVEPMIEPVIWAWTTRISACRKINKVRTGFVKFTLFVLGRLYAS